MYQAGIPASKILIETPFIPSDLFYNQKDDANNCINNGYLLCGGYVPCGIGPLIDVSQYGGIMAWMWNENMATDGCSAILGSPCV